MTDHPAGHEHAPAGGVAAAQAADPQAAVGGAQQPGAASIVGVDHSAAQASFYTQAGYYPTVSYAAGQAFGNAAQMMSSYQYVVPQAAAAYSQPTYGWAYYPSTNGQQDVAAAQAMTGMAVIPAKDTVGATPMSEREQKAMRRKQANRESARRSKIRKKTESESLGKRAETLDEEHVSLQTEMERYSAELEKLKSENEALREKVLSPSSRAPLLLVPSKPAMIPANPSGLD